MPSPFMTVVILTVLWLIVVVPMVLRRNDEKRSERSVAEWGKRHAHPRAAGSVPTGDDARTEVFVPAPRARSPRARASASPPSPNHPPRSPLRPAGPCPPPRRR